MHDTITTRRKVIIGSTAIVTGTGAVAALASEPAVALSVSGFDVEEKTTNLAPGETIDDVVLHTELDYSYSISHNVERVEFDVQVKNGDEYQLLASDSLSDVPMEDSGTVTLSGSLISEGPFTADNFQVGEGSTIALDVPVKATMRVIRNGRVVGTADAQDTGRIVLQREELTVSAQVGGRGTFSVAVQSS